LFAKLGPMSDDLLAQIRSLDGELRSEMQRDWNRDLPFEELAFDRWERARRLGFGAEASVYHNAYVYGDVAVGAGTWIGPFVLLDGAAGIEIGHHCSISAGVHVYTHDTVRWALSGGEHEAERGPVRIGDCCHIGAQTTVLRGVEIGDHCVIGANSVVNREIPPYSLAVGSPARVRGQVVVSDDGAIEIRAE
jgi:acetyltransferase-like isoleucine patch superfamily enzyme